MPCRIEISELELMIPIGCTEQERERPQPIRISASVSSREHFAASRTDRLSDTLDAAELKEILIEHASSARVQTLEKLGARIEGALRERMRAPGMNWEVSIAKPRFGWTYVHAWTT